MSRTTRTARAAAVSPTATDVAMLDDLLALGVATTPILLILRRSHADAAGVAGMANHRRRLAALFHDGFLSRFDDRFGVLSGSRTFVYALESGVAAGAAATRRHYGLIDATTWAVIREAADPLRERLTELLASRGHSAADVRTRLDQIATLCLRYYSGETTLRHKLTAATAAAILWLGARSRGIAVHTVRADGALAIAVARPEGGTVSIRPDLFFGLGATAVFIEAETGTATRAKVTSKLAQYAWLLGGDARAALRERTGTTFSTIRLLVHCATASHAELVSDVASAQPPALRDVLRITGPADLATDLAVLGQGEDAKEVPLAANDVVDNAMLTEHVSVFDYFRGRIAAPIFAATEGRDSAGAILYCTPLLDEVPR